MMFVQIKYRLPITYVFIRCMIIAVMIVGFVDISDAKANMQSFSADATYIMNNNESIKDAQNTALMEAMRSISQQATVLVKSSS